MHECSDDDDGLTCESVRGEGVKPWGGGGGADPSFFAVFQFEDEIFYESAQDKNIRPVNRAVANYKAVVEGSNMFFTGVSVIK